MREDNQRNDHPFANPVSIRPIFLEYVSIAFAWSWACWGFFNALVENGWLSALLGVLASFGSSIAAISLTAYHFGWRGGRQWLRQMIRWRVDWQWYVIALGVPAIVIAW